MSIERIGAALRNIVTRGKVMQTRVGSRTVTQVTGLDGEIEQTIEILLPPGYCARPAAGADVVLLQVLGQRDHLVALGGDAADAVIADLAPGEVGLKVGNQVIAVRSDRIEVISGKVVMPNLPNSPSGLPTGGLYRDGSNFVKWVP